MRGALSRREQDVGFESVLKKAVDASADLAISDQCVFSFKRVQTL